MAALGSAAHQALIARVVRRYDADPRVRAVAVFGSVAAGTWHELSDVDLDIVVADDAAVDPAAEARALRTTSGDRHYPRRLRRRGARLARGSLHPLGALAAVVKQATESFDLGPCRRALLERLSAEDEGELP
jgi:nucleotidyltransferase-like protein